MIAKVLEVSKKSLEEMVQEAGFSLTIEGNQAFICSGSPIDSAANLLATASFGSSAPATGERVLLAQSTTGSAQFKLEQAGIRFLYEARKS